MKKISVIIPVYNEQNLITDCLESLKKQSCQNMEIIIVDDGSSDNTPSIVSSLISQISNAKLLRQQHSGPGNARNFGVSKAAGEILVFVDADMTFDKNFIEDLTAPIVTGKTIGTFSKNEMVANPHNIWSKCWNINRNVPPERMLPSNFPQEANVFRAVLKKEFLSVGGFETSGQYIDDWSLSQKLGVKSTLSPGAVYYHTNPSSLKEVWHQARWIGKNSFLTGNSYRLLKSVIIYNPISSIVIGIYKSMAKNNYHFLLFKLVYDFGVLTSIIKSFKGESKFK